MSGTGTPSGTRRQLHREGITAARCTVVRLMRDLGLQGARRGKDPHHHPRRWP
ncbi:IS3 family transposase [Streptomyces krungchingensis]|uniref:IS3 family transposase n=1 Tax=Streptomyces sp. Tue6028 TaxID=2036037 RepID=UPI003EB6F255